MAQVPAGELRFHFAVEVAVPVAFSLYDDGHGAVLPGARAARQGVHAYVGPFAPASAFASTYDHLPVDDHAPVAEILFKVPLHVVGEQLFPLGSLAPIVMLVPEVRRGG